MSRALLLLLACSCNPATERQVIARLIIVQQAPRVLGVGASNLDDRSRFEELLKEEGAVLSSTSQAAMAHLSPPVAAEEAAAFQRALTIAPVPNSRMLEIAVRGAPPRAIELCNALLDEYLRQRNRPDVSVLDRCKSQLVTYEHWWNR